MPAIKTKTVFLTLTGCASKNVKKAETPQDKIYNVIFEGDSKINDKRVMASFNVGIDAFGSTIQSDDEFADSEYFSWLGQIQYAFKVLDNGAQIKARGTIQLSNEPLLSQENISVGGIHNVRGYRENELVRDQGYTGSLEFHYPIFGQVAGNDHKLVLIPFMDYGAAWNKSEEAEYLHSIGIGIHWQPIKYIKADFHYAHDLNHARDKTEPD